MGKGRECENKKNLSYKNTKRQRFFKPKAPHSNEIHDILLEWRRGTAKLWFQLNIPPLPLPRSHFLSQYCFTHDFRILCLEHKPERWFFVETHPAPTCIPVMLPRPSAFLQKPHLLGSSPPSVASNLGGGGGIAGVKWNGGGSSTDCPNRQGKKVKFIFLNM